MSGWELARAIRERDGAVPLAVITVWGSRRIAGTKDSGRRLGGGETFTMEQILRIAAEISLRRTRTAQELLSAAAA